MCVMHSNKQVISKHHFIRACFDNGETANLMLWITCPCPTLGEAKIPHKHYQFNRNPNRSRRVNKGGIKQFVTRAVVKKLYSWNLMTEETELFSQVSAPELLCKTLPRGNPDGIKRGKKQPKPLKIIQMTVPPSVLLIYDIQEMLEKTFWAACDT